MLRWILALFSCGVAAAGQPGRPVHEMTVSARLTPEGVHAAIQLDHPVASLAFSTAAVDRQRDMTILTPGLEWSEGDLIVANRPFRRFEILVRPASRELDAKYPAFFRVGTGGVLYGPSLKAGDGWRTRLRIRTARGEIHAPDGPRNIDGSVFIGPAAYVVRGSEADFITSPDTPALLRARVTEYFSVAMRTYTTGLRVSLDSRPIVVMAQGGTGEGFVGDVTPGPFVSLRFYGSSQEQVSDSIASRLTRFIAHEIFHFWNGSLAHNQDGGTSSWLHEGGADFAALLASRDAGKLQDEELRNELASALTRCRRELEDNGDVGMNAMSFLPAGVRYPCGIVIQWAASLEVARAGRGDFFDLWSRMIATARTRTDRAYKLSDFYTSIGSGNLPPQAVRLLTVERGPARWNELKSHLESLGVVMDLQPTPESRRDGIVFHLLGQICKSGRRGFYREPDRIRLQTNETCTLIPDNSILSSVEGQDISALDDSAYEAVRNRCAERDVVRIVLDGERGVAVPCSQDLAPARAAYSIDRWH
jgi:hypothetical protein